MANNAKLIWIAGHPEKRKPKFKNGTYTIMETT
jgi:hypothetical protein